MLRMTSLSVVPFFEACKYSRAVPRRGGCQGVQGGQGGLLELRKSLARRKKLKGDGESKDLELLREAFARGLRSGPE